MLEEAEEKTLMQHAGNLLIRISVAIYSISQEIMNVLFHTTAAIGIIAVIPVNKISSDYFLSSSALRVGIISFFTGIASHAMLDFIPHCYPINSKIDAILSLLIMLSLVIAVKRKYKLVVAATFFGSVFPDTVDLAPSIVNSFLGTKIPEYQNFLPWHWHIYSGSIYEGDCTLSAIYQLMLLGIVGVIIWRKTNSLKQLF